MKVDIRGVPEFYFSLTIPHLESLLTVARTHYDGVCQRASLDNHADGFIGAWRRIVANAGENFILSASWCELDICLKIMEMAPYHRHGVDQNLIQDLRVSFHRAMDRAREAREKWTA